MQYVSEEDRSSPGGINGALRNMGGAKRSKDPDENTGCVLLPLYDSISARIGRLVLSFIR